MIQDSHQCNYEHQQMKLNWEHWWFDLLGGCFGIAIALGLVRFDFGIIGSLMADAKWITVEDIGKLAAINMFGYLAGCIQQSYVKSREASIRYVLTAIITIIASIILEGRLINFTSQSILRLTCGWGAAHVVSGLPTLALERVPDQWRRKSTGLIMCGGGVGSLLGAIAIGLFSPTSAPSSWNVLAILTIILSLPTFKLVTRNRRQPASVSATSSELSQNEQKKISKMGSKPLILVIILGFAMMQVGQVPAILYEPLVAIKQVGLTPMMSSSVDSLFGIGLIIGGLIPSIAPSKLTTRLFLALISIIGLLGVILFGASENVFILSASIFLIGVWDMMTGTLTFDRLGQLCNEDDQRRSWSTATSIGALGFIIFSSATASLAKQNIDIILILGIAAVAIQFTLEWIQYSISRKQEWQ
ncbi:major Facilitator Superfamily protein [Synechococcus sp. BIOS-E4-1]|uniref:MFS transporter n=1 Tax=Synechococcus sp. BIOS-E4-1 TaxID=1400864 RepID=UPI00164516E2|nr:MFS transporter [Synechococcus sp. BIOS-E4-1]QNI55575.1 major Facilitator Superfamily protein [Synechococcus sp. BIOS-E4-1]